MAINGIEIQVGQKWRTHKSEIAAIMAFDEEDPAYPWRSTVGWHRPDGTLSVRSLAEHDLIELVEHADGFKPWAGGEQPGETRGKLVAYRLQNGESFFQNADFLGWGHFAKNGAANIVAYKVVGEVVQSVGEFASAASYSEHMGASEAAQPAPLRVELIEPPQDALDVQVGGDHYKSLAIQPVEYIHANKIGYVEGNVIKYVTRWRAKNGVADLEKAKHYIDLLIELEGGAKCAR